LIGHLGISKVEKFFLRTMTWIDVRMRERLGIQEDECNRGGKYRFK
jgi:hypothetical protein